MKGEGWLSDASRGVEREAFINAFLSDILTPQFRFGSGEITDQKGNRSNIVTYSGFR